MRRAGRHESAYGAPVYVVSSQLSESLPQAGILWLVGVRVVVYDILRCITRQLYELSVACDIGYLEVEGHS